MNDSCTTVIVTAAGNHELMAFVLNRRNPTPTITNFCN